jgi:ketosteroid isomerase-like protein
MNCEKLNQDIAKLQTLRDRFARKVDELNDSMRGKIETRKIQKEIQELENQVLESYLTEFKEKNPELFRWHLGEKINGFKGIAWSIAQLPEGEGVLVGGNVGTLYVCRKDKDGKWKLGEKIDGFEDGYGNSIDIASIAQLPDGEGMLVGGSSGKLFVCRKNEEGKWKLEEEISGFKDVWGDACNIETIAPLPDGEGMLVGGDSRALFICRKGADGRWKLEEKIDGFKSKLGGNRQSIYSIMPLPDKEGMLVGGDMGELRVCRKNEDGKWKLEEKIDGIYDAIYSIAQLPDKEGMLVGGDMGILYEVSRPALSTDIIKQNFDKIIQKGAV